MAAHNAAMAHALVYDVPAIGGYTPPTSTTAATIARRQSLCQAEKALQPGHHDAAQYSHGRTAASANIQGSGWVGLQWVVHNPQSALLLTGRTGRADTRLRRTGGGGT